MSVALCSENINGTSTENVDLLPPYYIYLWLVTTNLSSTVKTGKCFLTHTDNDSQTIEHRVFYLLHQLMKCDLFQQQNIKWHSKLLSPTPIHPHNFVPIPTLPLPSLSPLHSCYQCPHPHYIVPITSRQAQIYVCVFSQQIQLTNDSITSQYHIVFRIVVALLAGHQT